MGVQARIVVYAQKYEIAYSASAQAFERLSKLDESLSDYRRDSELNRLCDLAGGAPVPVSNDLFSVMTLAVQVARASDGEFDPTIAPCVRLWRQARHDGALPAPQLIDQAKALVNWRWIEADHRAHTLRLTVPGMKLDLGGIAKGFAAQQAVDLLRSKGLPVCLVSLAGDIVAGESPPHTGGWQIQVQGEDDGLTMPDGSSGRFLLHNAAVSTSGDREQVIEIDGRRYAHIVDPVTCLGSAIQREVTVISDRGEWSDALSTAAFLMGPERSGRLLEEFGPSAAIFVDSHGVTVVDPCGRIPPRLEQVAAAAPVLRCGP